MTSITTFSDSVSKKDVPFPEWKEETVPYYKDTRSTLENTRQRFYASGGVPGAWSTYSFTRDLQETTSFRTRPLNDNSVEVLDMSADPYGYFLRGYTKDSYIQNLKERGIEPVDPQPDTGHPFETMSFRAIGKGMSGTMFERVYDYGPNGYGYYSRPYSDFENRVMVPSVAFDFQDQGPFKGPVFGPATYPSSDLPNFAQRAIAKTRPSLVKFDAGRFLGELREGLPRLGIETLQGRFNDVLRNAGGDYLNVQFGWLPLLSDLNAAAEVLVGATQMLSGMPKQGKPIRRTWGLPPNVQTWAQQSNGLMNLGWSTGNVSTAPQGSGSVTKTLSRRQWFVGSYTTFYPLGFDPSDFMSRVQHMMSIQLTPSTLWELSPWTWLTDWALHIGASIDANLAAADESLHIHYAYAMEETTARYYIHGKVDNSWLPSTTGYHVRTDRDNFTYESETKWKRRIRANPFGFTSGGLSGLSTGQVAILAALGLSRT